MNFAGGLGDTGTVAAADGTTISDLAHPKWKANTAFGYARGPVSAALHWRYIGTMIDLATLGEPSIPAYSYFALEAHWHLLEKIDLTAGLTNLFDKGPPVVQSAPMRTDAAPYDVVGRTYYARIKQDFKRAPCPRAARREGLNADADTPTTEGEAALGHPRRERKFPRNVRFHGVRIFQFRHRPRLFSREQRIRIVDVLDDDIRGRFHGASIGCDFSRRLHRPYRSAPGFALDAGAHVGGHADDRSGARL